MLVTPMLHQGGFERICVLTAKLLKDRYDVYLAVFNTQDNLMAFEKDIVELVLFAAHPGGLLLSRYYSLAICIADILV